ncbi:type-F conjugative transfer system pilin assembly protein TrbC [Vibrio sp. 10N.286.46.E10]|uniref:type-F conjugative transfer system pilin assembly protein TrbC n=1 Tax=Vibrio sp. 10N.286.46.E10 TaxID=1884477 RepID=UPI0039A460BA
MRKPAAHVFGKISSSPQHLKRVIDISQPTQNPKSCPNGGHGVCVFDHARGVLCARKNKVSNGKCTFGDTQCVAKRFSGDRKAHSIATENPSNQTNPFSGFAINPEWFRTFSVTEVPTFVAIKPGKCLPKQPCNETDYDLIKGNLSIPDALNQLARGDNPEVVNAVFKEATVKQVLLITSLAIVSGAISPDQGDHYYDNVDWVKSAQKNIPSTAKGKLDVGDYCAGQGCDNDLRNPEQAQLNDGNMDVNARTHYQSNDKAQAVQTRFDKGRPDVKSDPAYEFALMNQDNAYEISHGLSNQYVDCDNATQCVIDDIPKVCRQPTNNTVPCTKMPTFTAVTSPVIYGWCPSGWSRHGRFCKNTRQECRYDSRNYVERSCGDFSLFTGKGLGLGFGNGVILDTAQSRGVEEENGTDYRENMKYAATLNNKSLRPYLVVVVIRFQAVTASKTPCVGPLVAIY